MFDDRNVSGRSLGAHGTGLVDVMDDFDLHYGGWVIMKNRGSRETNRFENEL